MTTYPPKGTDLRAKLWIERGWQTCQLEALPPDVLAGVLASTIEMFLNPVTLAVDREAEEQERRQIAKALPSPGS